MITKKLLVVCTTLLLLFGCSKDQRVVNKLVGTWQVESWKVSALGFSENLNTNNATYSFSLCQLKSEEWCSGKFTLDGETTNFQYKVIDGGKKFVSRNIGDPTETIFDIIEITKSKAEVKAQIELFTHEIKLTK